MTSVYRIDPISSTNKVISKDNFITNNILNKNILDEPSDTCPNDCICMVCRHKTEPKNGFWISFPTKNNTSSAWLDNIKYAIKNTNLKDFIEEWSNIRVTKYKLKPSAKIFLIDKPQDIIKYIMIAPPSSNQTREKNIQLNNIAILKKFLEDHKIEFNNIIDTINTINPDPSKRGITVRFDDQDNIIIQKGKSGSKNQILASVKYLLNITNEKLEKIQNKINDRIMIDYDAMKKDGYDGIQFGDLTYDKSFDDYLDKVYYFLERWIRQTGVIWHWCFEDEFETYALKIE